MPFKSKKQRRFMYAEKKRCKGKNTKHCQGIRKFIKDSKKHK